MSGLATRIAASPLDPSPMVQHLAGHALGCLLRSLDLSNHSPTQRGLLLEAMNALDDIEALIEATSTTGALHDEDDTVPVLGFGPVLTA